MKDLLKVVLVVLVIFLTNIFKGFVLMKLWCWFIVPTFGLPPVSLIAAIGAIFIISYVTYKPVKKDKSNISVLFEKAGHSVISVLMYSVLSLFFAYLFKLFM